MSECVTVWIAGFKSNASLIIPCRYINDGGEIVIFDIKLKKYSFNYKTNLVVRRPCDSFSSSAAFKDESNISCMLPSSLPICLKLLKNDGVEPAESTLSSCPYKCIFNNFPCNFPNSKKEDPPAREIPWAPRGHHNGVIEPIRD